MEWIQVRRSEKESLPWQELQTASALEDTSLLVKRQADSAGRHRAYLCEKAQTDIGSASAVVEACRMRLWRLRAHRCLVADCECAQNSESACAEQDSSWRTVPAQKEKAHGRQPMVDLCLALVAS